MSNSNAETPRQPEGPSERAPERPITIHLAGSGESFKFDPPDDLWLDMLAYCEVAGLTLQELINHALEEFLPKGVPPHALE